MKRILEILDFKYVFMFVLMFPIVIFAQKAKILNINAIQQPVLDTNIIDFVCIELLVNEIELFDYFHVTLCNLDGGDINGVKYTVFHPNSKLYKIGRSRGTMINNKFCFTIPTKKFKIKKFIGLYVNGVSKQQSYSNDKYFFFSKEGKKYMN